MAPGLSPRSLAFLVVVVAGTLAAALLALSRLGLRTDGWPTFLLLAAGAATAQLFVVVTPRNQSYHASIAFVIAAALLLPPELVVLIGVLQHVPEYLRLRHAWFVQTFNICNHTLAGLAAWGVAHLVQDPSGRFADDRWAAAALAACGAFVLVNHGLRTAMLWLARGRSLRAAGLFTLESLVTDGVLAALGVTVAALWHWTHWLVPFALLPLLLAQRALRVPALQEQARTDAKTGLLNPLAFGESLEHELARAVRFARPLSVLVLDLDHLREINNSFGHLAGDAALVGIADVLRGALREYDLACRFGGEEFAVLLPETGHAEALEIAERVRATIACRDVVVEAAGKTIRVTTSIGVASLPAHGSDAQSLLHAADVALYRAKERGRNRVTSAGEAGAALEEVVLASPAAPAASVPVVPGTGAAAALEGLSATVDARDPHTAGHSRRVRDLALEIGRELGLGEGELETLANVALLHDIGKLAVPDAILLKPSALSPAEWEVVRRHPEESARIVSRLGFLADAVPAILHHHERWDGGGYPHGIAGEEIPLLARIVHVADLVEAMRSPRSFRAARSEEETLDELERVSGTQLCPRSVGAARRALIRRVRPVASTGPRQLAS